MYVCMYACMCVCVLPQSDMKFDPIVCLHEYLQTLEDAAPAALLYGLLDKLLARSSPNKLLMLTERCFTSTAHIAVFHFRHKLIQRDSTSLHHVDSNKESVFHAFVRGLAFYAKRSNGVSTELRAEGLSMLSALAAHVPGLVVAKNVWVRHYCVCVAVFSV